VAERDSKPGTFDALAGVFSAVSVAAARGAMENIDESPEQFILWVDENLPRAYKDPADLHAGYMRLARADRYLSISRRTQVYRFWAYARDMMSAGVALAKGPAGASGGRYNFPQYLMKMSRSKGQRGLRDESSGVLARYTHSSTADIRVNYINYYKFLMKNHHALSVNIARRTRMDATTLAYLLDAKATSADVKEILKAAVEGMPADDGPSIDIGRATEVDGDVAGPWPSSDTKGEGGGKVRKVGKKRGKGESGKKTDGGAGDEVVDTDEEEDAEGNGGEDASPKGGQKSLFDY
jgi:replication factor C large subunit